MFFWVIPLHSSYVRISYMNLLGHRMIIEYYHYLNVSTLILNILILSILHELLLNSNKLPRDQLTTQLSPLVHELVCLCWEVWLFW